MPDEPKYRIDPLDPSPMNRFGGIDTPEEAMGIIRRMIDGEVFPEVTLWRLHSYCEHAVTYGRLLERREAKKSNPFGFSHQDVITIQREIDSYATGDRRGTWAEMDQHEAALQSLLARIAALLPPEGP